MKKQILIEQYTVEKFKTQYPRFNQILQDKLEGTNITLNELLYIIVQSDPTYIQSKNEVGKLQETILKLYCDQPKEKIVTEEFQNYVKEGFTKQYNYINSKGEKIDTLVNLTTVDKFETFIFPFKNIDSDNQKQGVKEYTYFEEIDQLINSGEIVKAQETNDWLMYIPLTEKQSILLGKKTKWCISQEKDNLFKKYTVNYVFLIQISKNKKENIFIDGRTEQIFVKYQFRLRKSTIECWNSKDYDINNKVFINEPTIDIQFKNSFQQLNTILKDKNYLQTAFENLKKDIETVNNLTKSEIISKLRNRLDSKNNAEYILSNLKNPTEDIKSQQIIYDGKAIKFIDDPSEDLKMEQVKCTGEQIRYIDNPSEQVQMQQVTYTQSIDGASYQIQYIKNPSEKVQLQQIRNQPEQILAIKNPCVQAFKYLLSINRYNLIIDVKEYDHKADIPDEILSEQIKKAPHRIIHLDFPSEQVQMQQIDKNNSSLKYFKVVPENRVLLKQIENQYKDLEENTEESKNRINEFIKLMDNKSFKVSDKVEEEYIKLKQNLIKKEQKQYFKKILGV